jgi:hypothetical protein
MLMLSCGASEHNQRFAVAGGEYGGQWFSVSVRCLLQRVQDLL